MVIYVRMMGSEARGVVQVKECDLCGKRTRVQRVGTSRLCMTCQASNLSVMPYAPCKTDEDDRACQAILLHPTSGTKQGYGMSTS